MLYYLPRESSAHSEQAMESTKLTPKQLEILLLLYRYRFLDRTHIQRFLHHKDPKRINTWLKDLTDKNIIGRKYSRKLKENTKPAIYHLATKSRRILLERNDANEKLLKRVYREKTRSQRLIDHCLLVADIHFLLLSKLRKNEKLHFFTQTDLVNHYYLPYKRPDAYIAVEGEKETKRYFLEIIDEGTPRFLLRSRIASLIEYFDEKTWYKKTNHPDPALLFVCPNSTLKSFLYRHISQVLEEEAEDELQFYLTSKEQIEYGTGNIWELVE